MTCQVSLLACDVCGSFRIRNAPFLDEERQQTRDMKDSDLACPAWEAKILAKQVLASHLLAGPLIAAGYAGLLVRIFSVGTSADQAL